MSEHCVCYDEVARLHQFFQRWVRGDLEESAFAQCEQALAPGFTIITPAGALIARDEILPAIRRHRGGEPANFEIRTVPRTCQQVRGLHLSTYEEQQIGARTTSRLSTAVLGDRDGSLVWHSVHETWITTTEL